MSNQVTVSENCLFPIYFIDNCRLKSILKISNPHIWNVVWSISGVQAFVCVNLLTCTFVYEGTWPKQGYAGEGLTNSE